MTSNDEMAARATLARLRAGLVAVGLERWHATMDHPGKPRRHVEVSESVRVATARDEAHADHIADGHNALAALLDVAEAALAFSEACADQRRLNDAIAQLGAVK